MSENKKGYSSFWQLIIVIPGTILAFTLLISLLAHSFGPGAAPSATPAAAPAPEVAAKADENIKPVAAVEVAAADAGPHVDKSGEEVVKAVCSMCHAAGLMNAPKIGDKDQWGPRIAQGYDTLVSHAINGIRSMPARGGNPALTDGEIANAVANMANQAGANFTPPKPAVAPVTEKVAAAGAGKSGEEVFKAVCSMCHGTGLMNSPKFGDKEAWAPRIAKGYDTLVGHALKGFNAMPAKGGNPALSDDEVAGAVKYMANNGGASF